MELQMEHYLATRLRACGHFLYYQTGGKTGQQRILLALYKHESLSQKELQDTLDLSSGALSEILQKMVEASLIKRKKSRSDRRQVILELTPGGKQLAQQAQERRALTYERMFQCLNAEEKSRLGEILDKLVEHMSTLKSDPVFMSGACPLATEQQKTAQDT